MARTLFDEPAPRRRAKEPKPDGPKRHKWVKIKLHHYCCKVCGMGRVNTDAAGYWQAQWHFPDGKQRIEIHVPPCEIGPLTAERLVKLEKLIAENKVVVDAGNWKAPF